MRVGGGGVLRLNRTWGLSRETEIRKLSQKGGKPEWWGSEEVSVEHCGCQRG